MLGRTSLRRQHSNRMSFDNGKPIPPSPRPADPASQKTRRVRPYVLGALGLATVLAFAWMIDFAASSGMRREGMSSGSMTQRGNALPGLAGALHLVLGKDAYQLGNGSFPAEGLPRVALMFLTRGPLPYEPVWRTFLDGIPDKQQEAVGKQGQHLEPWETAFSLFVHAPGSFKFPRGSLFSGREIKQRVPVEWGQWTVMEAERALLSASLAGDPWAARFLLLSESCIPLYPASVVWMQLMSQPLSRINACMKPEDPEDYNRRMGYRMHADMVTGDLMTDHWRKSSQWFALTREHADRIANDTQIRDIFAKECWVDKENLEKGWDLWRFCVSDEHYIPTLLAVLGLDDQTDCKGSVTSAWWDGPYFHPKTWQAEEMDAHLVTMLRGADNGQCPSSEAVRTADIAMQGVMRSSAPGSIFSGDHLWGRTVRPSQSSSAETSDVDEDARHLHRRLLGAGDTAVSEARSVSSSSSMWTAAHEALLHLVQQIKRRLGGKEFTSAGGSGFATAGRGGDAPEKTACEASAS
ncbi:hypothetical protein WJX84_001940 [Apatococcus fuscideae]|uniref:Uncharacterized protein n=1 Tax=Apatococcus fuscideae TaxID=2026836 RepID=A0AAW1SNE3_9CHLO